MTDREKVITGLQEAAAYFRSSFDAMYGTAACEKFRGWTDAIEQSIALLKAQDAVRPGIGIIHNDDGSNSYFLHCPLEGTTLDDGDKYCRKCGRAVKWDG